MVPSTVPEGLQDIPIVVLFRALGCESDRKILQHIIYDFEDQVISAAVAVSVCFYLFLFLSISSLIFITHLTSCISVCLIAAGNDRAVQAVTGRGH